MDETLPITDPLAIQEAVAVHSAPHPTEIHDASHKPDEFEKNDCTHSDASQAQVICFKVGYRLPIKLSREFTELNQNIN